jgi:hypothetical protein
MSKKTSAKTRGKRKGVEIVSSIPKQRVMAHQIGLVLLGTEGREQF